MQPRLLTDPNSRSAPAHGPSPPPADQHAGHVHEPSLDTQAIKQHYWTVRLHSDPTPSEYRFVTCPRVKVGRLTAQSPWPPHARTTRRTEGSTPRRKSRESISVVTPPSLVSPSARRSPGASPRPSPPTLRPVLTNTSGRLPPRALRLVVEEHDFSGRPSPRQGGPPQGPPPHRSSAR